MPLPHVGSLGMLRSQVRSAIRPSWPLMPKPGAWELGWFQVVLKTELWRSAWPLLAMVCTCSSPAKANRLQLADPDMVTASSGLPPMRPTIVIHLLWLYFTISRRLLVITDWRTGIGPRPDPLRRIDMTARLLTE